MYGLLLVPSISNHSPESPENSGIMAKNAGTIRKINLLKPFYALQNNLPVRLIDSKKKGKKKKAEQLLDMYFEQIYTAPDSALAGLQELTTLPTIKLGWLPITVWAGITVLNKFDMLAKALFESCFGRTEANMLLLPVDSLMAIIFLLRVHFCCYS